MSVLTAEETIDDEGEVSLRPIKFDDFVGQKKPRENLKVFIEAAKKRNNALDHVKSLYLKSSLKKHFTSKEDLSIIRQE